MHRLLALLLMAVLVACDPAPPVETGDGLDAELTAPDADSPELPAADPVPPTSEEFSAEAATACATAVAAQRATPLRGDPLTDYAKRRDVRAAVRHYTAAAQAWSEVAAGLFEFQPPDDARAQRFISALDVLAMRSRQVAEALGAGDRDDAQTMLGAAEQALAEADAAGRDIGLGPLLSCDQTTERTAGRRRIVVNAVDFEFQVADGDLPPGAARFVLRNRGDEDHQLFVVPLREPGTLADAVAADRRGERLGRFLAGQGATTAVARPGERVTVDMDLRPGPYGFVCFVASPDGTPHAYKGMALEVAVER